MINFDDFKKLDMRIARILKAEKIEGSSKLLKFQIDIGDEEKQLVAGLAKHYNPEDLVGREIVVVVNLEPKKLMGVESQGMLLAASKNDDIVLLQPDREIEPGSKIS